MGAEAKFYAGGRSSASDPARSRKHCIVALMFAENGFLGNYRFPAGEVSENATSRELQFAAHQEEDICSAEGRPFVLLLLTFRRGLIGNH
jgi:hypothetical protein